MCAGGNRKGPELSVLRHCKAPLHLATKPAMRQWAADRARGRSGEDPATQAESQQAVETSNNSSRGIIIEVCFVWLQRLCVAVFGPGVLAGFGRPAGTMRQLAHKRFRMLQRQYFSPHTAEQRSNGYQILYRQNRRQGPAAHQQEPQSPTRVHPQSIQECLLSPPTVPCLQAVSRC